MKSWDHTKNKYKSVYTLSKRRHSLIQILYFNNNWINILQKCIFEKYFPLLHYLQYTSNFYFQQFYTQN